ncbi:primosomal protein N' [Exiguobacterium sp. KRL4]|uniref:primosomal protein N' n=1 Tax=Exiguobacterium sp. KRL4 TaxID=1914536 RepID=UPI0008F89D00|nr:primosomal protein N' [Exiguobacterium sp. KRL4]OIN67843.1 primosomal protein N' [Exiguobacterium sp. KRL4]
MIAEVIVDVAAATVDRPFDYEVPALWQNLVVPGMRVEVPFGPRALLGIVVAVKAETELARTKPIVRVLDETPTYTEELLQLSSYLAETTLCYQATALLAMLPAALKVSYDKLILTENPRLSAWNHKKISQFPSEVQQQILFAAQQGELQLQPIVKEKKTTKTDKRIRLLDGTIELSKQATKQIVLRDYLMERQEVLWSEVMHELDLTVGIINSLEKKGVIAVETIDVNRNPYEHLIQDIFVPSMLTDHQQQAVDAITRPDETSTFLLHGVTGSGKTEVYLESIHTMLERGRQAMLLVPEISLTPMMVKRFKRRFGERVAVLHSGLSLGEKYDEWRKIAQGEVDVVVGARSAIFAPLTNIGVIILDEEHETTYKQEENPRYHTRDVATWRAAYHGCPVVLGSATPILETYARAQKGVYRYLPLKERFGGELPPVDIIDMRKELERGNRTPFSLPLIEGIKRRIERGEQTVLLLNRRGYTTFVLCRDCGETLQCPHCAVNLTYHQHQDCLKCHYCGFEAQMPKTCPACESKKIRQFGTGTQKIEEELAHLIPEAKIIRMDQDTTSRKGAHEKLLNAFERGEGNILLGTQMIAKGLDFPNVTLVGVIAADATLGIPDFRASERTFQLITQVSGRAGRGALAGQSIIQTYNPEHYVIQTAKQHDYEAFYKREMQLRKLGGHPPFWFLGLITISAAHPLEAQAEAEAIALELRHLESDDLIVNGPLEAPLARLKNMYRQQVILKHKGQEDVREALRAMLALRIKQKVQVTVDLNPFVFM